MWCWFCAELSDAPLLIKGTVSEVNHSDESAFRGFKANRAVSFYQKMILCLVLCMTMVKGALFSQLYDLYDYPSGAMIDNPTEGCMNSFLELFQNYLKPGLAPMLTGRRPLNPLLMSWKNAKQHSNIKTACAWLKMLYTLPHHWFYIEITAAWYNCFFLFNIYEHCE